MSKRMPQDQMHLGDEWVIGLIHPLRGEYRDREWHGTIWPIVWCEEEQRFYVARRRLAKETLGVAEESLLERLNADPIVFQGTRKLLVPSAGGAQMTSCFPFDDLPYVLSGIQPNACREEFRADLIYLKGLSRDVLRDVLIYGRMPEVLRERQQGASDDVMIRFDTRLQSIERLILSFQATMANLERRANDTWLEAAGTRVDLSDMQGTLTGIKEDTGVIRGGYGGVLIQQLPAEVREKPIFFAVNGTSYVLVDSVTPDPAGLGRVRISAGEVSYIEQFDLEMTKKRILGESRYNGAKHGGPWVPCMAFFTDDRKQAQDNIHTLIERADGELEPGRKDVYWVWVRTIDDCAQFPPYLLAKEIFLFAQQNGLFSTPMENNI